MDLILSLSVSPILVFLSLELAESQLLSEINGRILKERRKEGACLKPRTVKFLR